MRALFVCSRNRLRSPTAEQVFANVPGLEVDSAGLAPDADTRLTPEQVDWADVIFVMEKQHRSALSRRFRQQLKGKRVICLDIPDDYGFMDPALVEALKNAVPRHLPTLLASSG
jgi:predicted protein tyrosine phosphatase